MLVSLPTAGRGVGAGSTSSVSSVVQVETPAVAREVLVADARTGLLQRPRQLSPRWLYDSRGSELFEAITRLPEYYLTERERSVLERRSEEIARRCRVELCIELGSGTSEKTCRLLDALTAQAHLTNFCAFDVCLPALESSVKSLRARYPALQVQGVVGDFTKDLPHLPSGNGRLVLFLGSTVGNLAPRMRAEFFRSLARSMSPGDWLLLGTDLWKATHRLHAAYDDAAGVTSKFNLNALQVLNRELDADFDLSLFRHVAHVDPTNRWVEMLLVSQEDHSVQLRALGEEIFLARDEAIRTEISCKFSFEQVAGELWDSGFAVREWWPDDRGDFAVSLSELERRVV